MNRLLMAALLIGLSALPAKAEETAPASYGWGSVGARYVDLDTRGSHGQVLEYDGRLYRGAHGDVSLSRTGTQGLVDFELKDIGSTMEYGSLFADIGSTFKGSMKLNKMFHRQNMTDFGLVINGLYTKVPTTLETNLFAPVQQDFGYRRTEFELNLAYFCPQNSARWLTGQYWRVAKVGDMMASYYNTSIFFKPASVDNLTEDITLGAGTNLAQKGAMNLDLVYRKFRDDAAVFKFGTGVYSYLKPRLPNVDMNAAEMKFRYDPSKSLAFTGALTGRRRENFNNLYKTEAAVAAFNAAYTASKKLSLTARLYTRYVQVDENRAYRGFAGTNLGNYAEFDKLQMRADLSASYRPIQKALVKAGYRIESIHRRDAPEQLYTSDALYTDGLFIPGGTHSNHVAGDETKHTASVGVKGDLPFGVEAGLDFKKMRANRGTFINSPTQAAEASAELIIPLPAHMDLSMRSGYLDEGNREEMTNYHQLRNNYRVGLDWEAARKVFVGVDGSYESIRRYTDTWWGQSNAGIPSAAASGLEHLYGTPNIQKDTTAGVHGRVGLPKGFVVLGNGSYTWSTIQTAVGLRPHNDGGVLLEDLAPVDVHIARGMVALEYTPPQYKYLTARASYRVDDWVDRFDVNNSGRASVSQVGLDYRF